METWRGPDCLRPMLVPLSDLHEDPRNARKHSERNIEAIRRSMDAWGQDQPAIALQNGRVIVGNGRLRAATELGWTHLAVVRSELNDRASALRAIADNRTAELADWDFSALRDSFENLDAGDLDMDLSGFSTKEIEGIMSWTEKEIGVEDVENAVATLRVGFWSAEIPKAEADALAKKLVKAGPIEKVARRVTHILGSQFAEKAK